MNLNGKNKVSGTILNGRPLHDYDKEKWLNTKRHRVYHIKSTNESRRFIGKEPMYKNNDELKKMIPIIALIIVVIIYLSIIMFIF